MDNSVRRKPSFTCLLPLPTPILSSMLQTSLANLCSMLRVTLEDL